MKGYQKWKYSGKVAGSTDEILGQWQGVTSRFLKTTF